MRAPGPKGLEHLRAMERAASYPNAAVWDLSQRYGDVFVFGFGPIRFHWLVGAEALKFVLQDRTEAFRMRRAYDFLHPIGGNHALITSDEPEHLRLRRLVQPAFHRARLEHSTTLIGATMRALYKSSAGQRLDFYHAVRPLILTMITDLLIGSEARRSYPRLIGLTQRLMDFPNLPFLAQLFKVNLPGTPWARFVRVKAEVDAMLYTEIAARRSRPDDDHDILGLLIAARDENGDALTDVEIRDQALSLISAGFDTTSAGLSWALYLLLMHPEVKARLRDDLDHDPDAPLKLPYLDAVTKETLRLYPPAPAGLRQAAEDVEILSIQIPKGSLLAYSIYATQRQERYFPDALAFKPERWLKTKPAPFSHLPFGHGPRYCIGAGLATTIIKLALVELLAHYEVEPVWTGELEETGNTLHPKGGLPVRIRAR